MALAFVPPAARMARVGTVSPTHPAVKLVDLRETPLDVAEVVGALEDDASGGLTLFIGQVCDRVAEQYDVHGVAAVHRVGTLAIGDIAVIVATTAAHRGEAFTASKALIDTLKAEIPIWKHQRFGDGTEEWVGAP